MEHNRSAIRTLIWANAISGLAQGISMIAIPWYMVHALQQESLYGFIFLCITFCVLFWAPYAGTLIDRYPRKNIFLALNLTGFTVLGCASAFGFIHGEVNMTAVVCVLAFSILNFNLHYPALYTFTHEISAKGDYGRVNSILEIQGQSTQFLAGALAAVLMSGVDYAGIRIRPWSLHEIFLADCLTYLIAFILISRIRYTAVIQEEVETGSVFSRLRSGWKFLLGNKRIMIFGMCSYVVFATLIVSGYYLMQVYIENHLRPGNGARVLAVCEITYTAGALAAGFLTRRIFPGNPIRGIYFLMLLCSSLLLVIGTTRSVWVFVLAGMVYGWCNSGIRILRVTWLFEHVPNRMMGRAGSAFNNFNIMVRMSLVFTFSMAYFVNHISMAYLVMSALVMVALVVLIVTSGSTSATPVNKTPA